MRLMLSSDTRRDTPSPRGSKIDRVRKRGRSGGRTGQSEEGKVRKSPLFWFSGRLFLLLQLMQHHKFLLQDMSPLESNWFYWVWLMHSGSGYVDQLDK